MPTRIARVTTRATTAKTTSVCVCARARVCLCVCVTNCEGNKCYGTSSLEHPGVQELCFDRHALCIGGKIHGLALPEHKMQCDPPAVVRQILPKDEPSAFFLISRSTPTANAEGARADLKGTLKAPASSRDHSRWLPLDPGI